MDWQIFLRAKARRDKNVKIEGIESVWLRNDSFIKHQTWKRVKRTELAVGNVWAKIGKYHLPKNLEFSQLLFDEQIDILPPILSIISEKVNDEYKNANNETVCIKVKEITKIEDTNLSLPVACDIYEIDEKLYTFEKSMTFHEFRKIYNLGSYLS